MGIALPIIGHLFKVFKEVKDKNELSQPHIFLNKLSKRYGKNGILRLWMGEQLVYICSDPFIAREIFVNNFNLFSNRPKLSGFKKVSNNFIGILFQDFKNWKILRPIIASPFTKSKLILSNLESFEKKTQYLISSMKANCENGEIFDTRYNFGKYVTCSLFSMLFGCKIEEFENFDNEIKKKLLKATVDDVIQTSGSQKLDDFFSFLRPFFIL